MARLLTWGGQLIVVLGVAAGIGAVIRSFGLLGETLPAAGPMLGAAVGGLICGLALTVLGLTLWNEADKRAETQLD